MEVNQSIPVYEAKISESLKVYLENNFNKNQSTFKIDKKEDKFWKQNIQICSDEKNNAFDLLKNCFPQLNFPIENEVDKSQEYRNATLKGMFANQNTSLLDSTNLSVEYFNGFSGAVPIITIQSENEFVKLIQSLCYKNSPVELPRSMGASFINGINNWKKIHDLKGKWLQANPFGDWNKEFSSNILSNSSLFKEKIIVLSTKPYSNISASTFEISESLWKDYSHSIRKNHELTHYYTLQKYGSAKNNLHDELIADYVGIITTIGSYNKNWMLTFMGLEDYPKYRNGARLENYLSSTTQLNSEEFKTLLKIVKEAIQNICVFNDTIGKLKTEADLCRRIDTLCETDLWKIASKDGASFLIEKYKNKNHLSY